MLNEKLLWSVVVLCFFAIVGLGIVGAKQHRELSLLSTRITELSTIPDTAPTSTTKSDSAGDPLLSPDGRWQLSYRKIGNDQGSDLTDSVTHVFYLQSTRDPSVSEELFREEERVNKESDNVGTKIWSLLGWDRSGTSIFLGNADRLSGLGGNYPDLVETASRVIRYDLQMRVKTTVLDLAGQRTILTGIYTDGISNPKQDTLVYSVADDSSTDQVTTLHLASFSAPNRSTIVMQTKDGNGITQVDWRKDGASLDITTHTRLDEQSEESYRYDLWRYELATKNLYRIR